LISLYNSNKHQIKEENPRRKGDKRGDKKKKGKSRRKGIINKRQNNQ
jgi:hypothetical protein